MSIASISQFIATQQPGLQRADARTTAALEKIAQKASQSVLSDSATEITGTQALQSKATSFRKAAATAAQAGDILKIANSALSRVEEKLSRFQQKGSVSAADIAELRSEIAEIAQNTQFGGKSLLEGDFSNREGVEVTLPDLRPENLLQGLDVNSLESVAAALSFVSQQKQDIAGQQDNVEIVTAIFEVSAQNQEALQATFPSTDELSLLQQVASQQQSVTAQANRLQPNILNLIQS